MTKTLFGLKSLVKIDDNREPNVVIEHIATNIVFIFVIKDIEKGE